MSARVYYSLDHLFRQHGRGCAPKWELQCLYVYIIPLITYFPNMEGVAHRNENCNVCICILFLWSPIFPSRWGMLREMRIAMYVFVYYSLDHIFPKHGGGCSHKWELQCLYVYIIPLITYFPKHVGGCSHKRELQCLHVYIIPLITYFPIMEGDAERNENCNVCVCILFPCSPISPTWRGLLTGMRIACLYMYIIPLITYFPNMEGDAERNENCNVCVCILFPWSPISPTWRGFLTEMRIALSVYVYYSFDHLFPQHGRGCAHKWELQCICVYYSFDHLFSHHEGGCWEKWELQCLCVYIIPLITYFPNMEGVSHRNENCIVCICILFLWSPISPTWKGFLTERIIAMSARVYYSLDHLFRQHGRGCAPKWELQCLYVYIIPLITYFPNMEGVAHRNENCNVCIWILFLWSPIFPSRWGMLREMRIAMYVFVYYSLDHIFPKHGGGCSHKWELQCLYVYIIPLITYFPKHVGGCSHKRELQCLHVYIIPLITYFPIMEGMLREMRIATSVCVYYSLAHLFPQHGGGCSQECELHVCICILFLWSPISPTWRGMLREMRIAMSVCVYYSLDHLFPQHGGGFSQKWELHCLYMYIIPLITYFPNMEGVAHINENCNVYVYIIPLITYFPIMKGDAERNENCNVCVCILFPWSPISPTWRGFPTEMRIALSVYVYYSFDHLFPQHGRGFSQK